MARSGRFGRLPAEAPDLTSSIVAMMREWQNQRDNNIIDAWKNGTEFEGSKVTDGRLFAYMKDRRDSYTRDDPEWDEWNTLRHEYQFNVAEQKALLRYDQAMAAAAGIVSTEKSLAAQRVASASMAAFYRGWANRVPHNSAAWREVMRSAAQFAKAAQAAKAQQARADAAERRADRAADKPSAYDQYVSRREAIFQRDVKPFNDLMMAMDAYAAAAGLIQPGQTVANLNINEQRTFGALLDGLAQHDVGGKLERMLRRSMPGTSWNGHLNLDAIDRMAQRADAGYDQMIAAARRYPGDLSSHIAGFKAQQQAIAQLASLDERIDTGTLIAKAYEKWQKARADADDPQAEVEAADAMLAQLKQAKALAMRGSDPFLVGQIQAHINALKGDTSYTVGLDPQDQQPMWGGNMSLDATARMVEQSKVDAKNISERPGRWALTVTPGATDSEGPLLDEEGNVQRRFGLLDRAEQPILPTDSTFFTHDSAGRLATVVVPGEPVFMDRNDETPDAYVSFYKGDRSWKVPTSTIVGRDPATGELIRQTTLVPVGSDSVSDTGVRIEKVAGRWVVTSSTTEQQISALSGGEQVSPGVTITEADLTPAQMRARDRLQMLQAAGFDANGERLDEEPPSSLRVSTVAGAAVGAGPDRGGIRMSTLAGASDDEVLANIEQRLDARYPSTVGQDPLALIMPGATGPEAWRAQTAMSPQNEYVTYATTYSQGIAANPGLLRPGERDQVLQILAADPTLSDVDVERTITEIDRTVAGTGLADRFNDMEDGSGRLTRGAIAGYGTTRDPAREAWSRAVEGMTRDPAARARLEAAYTEGATADRASIQQRLAVNTIAGIFGKQAPTTAAALPPPPRPPTPERANPDIQMPANLNPLIAGRTSSGLRPPTHVMMAPSLTQAVRIAPHAPPNRVRNPAVTEAIRVAAQTRAPVRQPTRYATSATLSPVRQVPIRTASGIRPTTTTQQPRTANEPPLWMQSRYYSEF